jgi:hypothetical protein
MLSCITTPAQKCVFLKDHLGYSVYSRLQRPTVEQGCEVRRPEPRLQGSHSREMEAGATGDEGDVTFRVLWT